MAPTTDGADRIGYAWAERWNERDIDGLAALYSPECRSSDLADGSSFHGTAGIRDVYTRTVQGMPDFRLRCDNSFASGNRYVIEWTMWATISGERREVPGISVGTLDDQGRILERRDYWDTASLHASPLSRSDASLSKLT